MKKKLVSVLLSAALVATLLAGCGGKTEEPSTETGNTDVETQQPDSQETQTGGEETQTPDQGTVAAEEIPSPVYYYSFDAADDSGSIKVAYQDSAATPIVQTSDEAKTYIPGVKGDAIYTNGVKGYKLVDVNGVGDTYSVSFWIYATRFANYMPTIQFGPDMHGDATGGQHYLNITRAEWNSDGAAFPCIWAYDQLDNGLWPAWAPSGNNEHLKEWVNVTLVVDANNVSTDGTMLVAQLYVNGEELVQKDSDGEIIPINVVNGTMAQSDNFDFLVGINYWDAVFKGAFDELYIFDKALTAGQALALYQMGDPTVAFEEPERIITVTADEGAIESIGALDYSTAFGTEWSSAYAIKDGETVKISLKNWSDGTDSKNNYAMMFTASNDAAAAYADGSYAELLYADATAERGAELTYDWGNWTTWNQSVMVEANVAITIERNGNVINVKADNVDYNGTSNVMTAVITSDLNADDPCNLFFTTGNCYVDILSAKSMSVNTDGIIVGATDCSTAFWTAFSDIWTVPAGTSKTVNFTNYTSGAENWHNFLAVLQTTPEGHSADTEGYAEYAVLRADNWGWGAGYDGIATTECDWNWDTFKSDMDGAKVALTVTNNGDTADVTAVVTTTTGTVYTQKYAGIAVTGDLSFCLTCEGAYLSIEPSIVGATDCSTAFWTAFSDIWSVASGTSKTVNFTNYTSGAENWHNFLVVLQTTPEGHSADTEGYAEYAVLRADNWGWGAGYDGIAATECDWNWDTFKSDMDGAQVALTVTNNGDTADVTAVVTTTAGTVYTQKYTGITVTGDLNFCLTCEGAYLVY